MADRAYNGIISAVYEREWRDKEKNEDIILRSFQIEGEKRYFRTGTNELGFDKGTAIKFVADARGNVDLKSVEKIDEGSVTPPKQSNSSGGSKRYNNNSGNSRDTYWEDKAKRDAEITEPRISYSAAQRNATALVVAALQADILSFGQAAKGKKLDMLVDFVEQTTIRLAELQLAAPEILKKED